MLLCGAPYQKTIRAVTVLCSAVGGLCGPAKCPGPVVLPTHVTDVRFLASLLAKFIDMVDNLLRYSTETPATFYLPKLRRPQMRPMSIGPTLYCQYLLRIKLVS